MFESGRGVVDSDDRVREVFALTVENLPTGGGKRSLTITVNKDPVFMNPNQTVLFFKQYKLKMLDGQPKTS